MHELSLCRALLATAEQQLAGQADRPVKTLCVSIGALSGCEPELLQRLFPHATEGTRFANAALHIAFQPTTVHCHACGKTGEVPPNRFACPSCTSLDVHLIAGDGVFLTGITLEGKHDVS